MHLPDTIPKPVTIFIIDDDEDDQLLLEEALLSVNSDNTCFFCSDGIDGLKKLRGGILPRPDVIFADVNMPLLGGKQFLIQIKKDPLFCAIPVIIYSTSSFETEIKALIFLGAESFLKKPSDFNTLEESLHTILSALPDAKNTCS